MNFNINFAFPFYEQVTSNSNFIFLVIATIYIHCNGFGRNRLSRVASRKRLSEMSWCSWTSAWAIVCFSQTNHSSFTSPVKNSYQPNKQWRGSGKKTAQHQAPSCKSLFPLFTLVYERTHSTISPIILPDNSRLYIQGHFYYPRYRNSSSAYELLHWFKAWENDYKHVFALSHIFGRRW